MGLLDLAVAQRALENNGDPVAGARLYVYPVNEPGILVNIYKDFHLTIQQANPLRADEDGNFPPCYVIDGLYRMVVETPRGEVLTEVDNISISTVLGSGEPAALPKLGFCASYQDVAALIEDTALSYAAQQDKTLVGGGDTVVVWTDGFRYEVAPEGATDADIATAGGVSLYVCPTSDGSVSDRQFGHIVNDADRLNATIAWAIKWAQANHEVPRIVVRGNYSLDKPLKAFSFDGTIFSYASIHIEGSAQGYMHNQRTSFTFTDLQSPGIVIQKLRQFTLRNVAVKGTANNLLLPSYSSLLTRNGWWNTNGAVESGQYKLHAGICVDPFYSAMPANEKFAVFDGSGAEPDHYAAPSGSGTTQLLVENCDVQGWIVGVMCSGSDVQLGDSITVSKSNLSYNRWPFFIGESQNRGCVMKDCHAKGFDVLMVGGSGYGAGTGALCYIRGGVFVHGHSIVAGEVARGNGAVTDAYFESIWAIGHVDGGHGFSFKDSQIKLIDAATSNLPDVDMHLTGNGPVNFFGGYIGKYKSAARRLKIQNKINVDGATFDDMPFFADYSSPHIQTMNLRYANGPYRGVHTGHLGALLANALPGVGARIMSLGDEWTCISEWEAIYNGSGTVTVAGDGSAVVTGLDMSTVSVGDEIGINDGWSIVENNGGNGTARRVGIGLVNSVTATDVHLTGVPVSLQSGTYAFYTYRMPLMHQFTFGDLTNGSDTITNVSPTGKWKVGDWIKADGLPNYCRVTAVSGTTIALNKTASSSRIGTELYDARVVLTYSSGTASPVSGTYPTGSFVRNAKPVVDAQGKVLTGWACTAGGAPGTWAPQYASAVA
ncbi:hypothetical protein KZZ07_24415 [Mameliella sp. CS4]|uniref:hypothetical protein n=1 Tax=Mameliella sp. CS4 TaxID=2862329 RepID=UPI001C5DACDC|nr:hypothetical protein [Mameliella sp. CS4]MBW4985690.1 hypothetical protein [Mameliella sp. CS4]